MTTAASDIPAPDAILCETCGYTLTGVPPEGNCPECGTPIAQTLHSGRAPAAWERRQNAWARLGSFVTTSASVILRPTRFYRTLATRIDVRPARNFARWHWAICAVLFGLAAFVQAAWYAGSPPTPDLHRLPLLIGMMLGAYTFLAGTTWVAARLTAWEAAYRGYRLPRPVVARGLYFHAAHLLPVAVVAAITVVGYQLMLHHRARYILHAPTYLYVLSGEVVVAAAYLFQTYWIGMRNMMYANR